MLIADYVIVGAGLAGIPLAVRLSENPNVTVTVLEAGGDKFHDVNLDTPAYILNNLGDPNKDWSFFSAPQAHLGGRSLYLPRGKGIGGSSLLHYMEVNRASVVEYNALGQLVSPDWSWNNLLSYFRKSETFTYSKQEVQEYGFQFDKLYQGTKGPVQRTIPRWIDQIAQPWIKTLKLMGIQYDADANDGGLTGAWLSTHTIDRHSVRSSAASASAYYEPNQSRANLKVITGAHAARVLTSTTKGTDAVVATGVEFLKDGTQQTIQANKEVILCAGSYQTPQLLELSGIGDPDVLSKFDIPVVVDLPGVGKNLQVSSEHVTVPYTAKLTPGHTTWENLTDPSFAKEQEDLYKTAGGGMLSTVPSTFAFLPFKDFDQDGTIARSINSLTLPNTTSIAVQKQWVHEAGVAFLELNAFDRFIPGLTVTKPEPNTNYMSTFVILLHPFSRGSVHIASRDPTAPPNIDVNMLEHDTDIAILVRGYRIVRELARAGPLKDHIASEVSPGEQVQTDEELAEYIRKTAGTTYHPVATVSMLPRNLGGCVDAELKVYGTANLRVVDASIFPFQMSGHPQATLYAVVEKIADVIKSENRK
ncbi:hypothetical protein D9615_010490 [Tricholomella constricta]|uniref:Glucose-methanol-choline oxidoreductase N-terminal domain-containing protein n=1 Tax=Tricholomella constricta TaxID=117010 RepID=A0A8H5GMV1_9AGAR|nr:hypothetical protein D9615_010490 [Tricholomella constricta]